MIENEPTPQHDSRIHDPEMARAMAEAMVPYEDDLISYKKEAEEAVHRGDKRFAEGKVTQYSAAAELAAEDARLLHLQGTTPEAEDEKFEELVLRAQAANNAQAMIFPMSLPGAVVAMSDDTGERTNMIGTPVIAFRPTGYVVKGTEDVESHEFSLSAKGKRDREFLKTLGYPRKNFITRQYPPMKK